MNNQRKSIVGKRVVLARVRHDEYRDQTGIVTRRVKCRDVYEVRLDNGIRYDALLENIDVLGDAQ